MEKEYFNEVFVGRGYRRNSPLYHGKKGELCGAQHIQKAKKTEFCINISMKHHEREQRLAKNLWGTAIFLRKRIKKHENQENIFEDFYHCQ